MSLPAITKHLKVLERAGLISAAARRNGVLASWRLSSRCNSPLIGSSNIESFGKTVSIGLKIISANCRRRKNK